MTLSAEGISSLCIR